jgi:rhodanese-related sulfurtransferase
MPPLRRFLILGSMALIGAGFAYPLVYPAYGGTSLDAETAFQKVKAGEIILIDIRRPDEWAATGTAEGAYPLDLRREDFVAALTKLTGGDHTRPIALICARGVRSARMANLLSENGFTAIINIPEGMLGSADGPGWIARGLPLAK